MELVTGKDSAVAGLAADDEKLFCATRCYKESLRPLCRYHNHDDNDESLLMTGDCNDNNHNDEDDDIYEKMCQQKR